MKRDVHDTLDHKVQSCTHQLDGLRLIQSLAQGELTREQFKHFTLMRYLWGRSFEYMLKSALTLSEDYGALYDSLLLNWHDEIGSIDGQLNESLAHRSWRRDYLAAMDMHIDHLDERVQLSAGNDFANWVVNESNRKNLFGLCGALLYFEYSIPIEYRAIQSCRNTSWADRFVDAADDNVPIRTQKAAARKFVDDHIIHDQTMHYPGLHQGLISAISTDNALTKTLRGIDAGARYKRKFYQQAWEVINTPDS